ncbi:uncharacterized protein LOC119689037 [Teleopsis dalmanni]|uniref:uncharacterized protein LOC119689037 n=1 Tax=Teleopsis dalmanni TaxID=139649 RepID=UPI0018CF819E|nr:uncharacterized protein LOC119689037 [Teleopsis dalmanni]
MVITATTLSTTPTTGSTSSTCTTLEMQPSLRQHANSSSPTRTHTHTSTRTSSILDSPTLARVERARLRLEISNSQQQLPPLNYCNGSSSSNCNSNATTLNGEGNYFDYNSLYSQQSLVLGRMPIVDMPGLFKRGILWQQRDRLFSRWKERYFVLTRDYLNCFKKATGNNRLSDMGKFIFKIKLVDIEKVEWLNRRSYSIVRLFLGREGSVLLRCNNGLEEWFELLNESTIASKQRRHALKLSQSPRSRASLAVPISHATLEKQHCILGGDYTSAVEDWRNALNECYNFGGKLHNTGTISNRPMLFSDSVPDLNMLKSEQLSYMRTTNFKNQMTAQKNIMSSAVVDKIINSENDTKTPTGTRKFVPVQMCDEDSDPELENVQLRRPQLQHYSSTQNGYKLDENWQYCKPMAPTENRHSAHPILPVNNNRKHTFVIKSDLYDSGFETPTGSTKRPSSYRELTHVTSCPRNSNKFMQASQYQASKDSLRRSLQHPIPTGETHKILQEHFFKTHNDTLHCTNMSKINHSNCSDNNESTALHHNEAITKSTSSSRRASMKSALSRLLPL